MKKFWNTIQLIFAAVGGWLGYFLGGCDGLLYALIAFVVIDYMSPIKASALSVVGATPAENYRIHTVVHGDTLWGIAKKYLGNGSCCKEIVSLNGLESNVIYSGMKLKIPNK